MCLLVGLAEAIRGNNVDRRFFGISMGGIGQSINTHLLANLLGPLHRYLDLNVHYQDEEMRKQSGNYEDTPVVTGQERPEGSREQFRTRLFNLHMAADPTAQRDLYNRVTRMIELKRLETIRAECNDHVHVCLRRKLLFSSPSGIGDTVPLQSVRQKVHR